MRKLIKWAGVLVVLFVAGISFLRYFPQIWGEAIYPLPEEYRGDIAAAAAEFDLPKNLIAALFYTESRFNPNAQSGAGAIGFGQLLPSTAAAYAPTIGINNFTVAMLRDPKVNIRISVAYLRANYDRFLQQGADPDFVYDLTLANYNGGPGAAARLLATKNRSVLPRETQGFIPTVRKRWDIYDELYGKDWSGPQTPIGIDNKKNFNIIEFFNPQNLLNIFFASQTK